MRVFRFMSKEEFEKYNNGEKLINTTRHLAKTNSRGFCFFNFNDFTPEYACNFVSGIVSFDICAIFEVDKKYLNESYGIYHNPNYVPDSLFEAFINKYNEAHKMKVKEYSTTSYNKSEFKIIKYTEDVWKQHFFINKEMFEWKKKK